MRPKPLPLAAGALALLVGLPLLSVVAPDQALAGALLAVLLVNGAGALTLARVWLPPGPWRLVVAARGQPQPLFDGEGAATGWKFVKAMGASVSTFMSAFWAAPLGVSL